VLGTVVFVYGGHVFPVGGWREVRDRQPGMMLLVSLAITVAFLASAATVAGLLELNFWWELSALVTVMLLGHWQEMRAVGRTRGALAALAELSPTTPSASPTTAPSGSRSRRSRSATSCSSVRAHASRRTA
jgi:P-type Cu2+ transporter